MLTHSHCVTMHLSIWFLTPWPCLPIHQHAMDSCSRGTQTLQLVPDPPCSCQVFLLLFLTQEDKGFILLSKILTRCPAQSIVLTSNTDLFYRYDMNEHKIRAQTQFHVTLSTLPFCCSARGRRIQEYQQPWYSLKSGGYPSSIVQSQCPPFKISRDESFLLATILMMGITTFPQHPKPLVV